MLKLRHFSLGNRSFAAGNCYKSAILGRKQRIETKQKTKNKNKEQTSFKIVNFFVCPSAGCLRPSRAVLYHVTYQLQRAPLPLDFSFELF